MHYPNNSIWLEFHKCEIYSSITFNMVLHAISWKILCFKGYIEWTRNLSPYKTTKKTDTIHILFRYFQTINHSFMLHLNLPFFRYSKIKSILTRWNKLFPFLQFIQQEFVLNFITISSLYGRPFQGVYKGLAGGSVSLGPRNPLERPSIPLDTPSILKTSPKQVQKEWYCERFLDSAD